MKFDIYDKIIALFARSHGPFTIHTSVNPETYDRFDEVVTKDNVLVAKLCNDRISFINKETTEEVISTLINKEYRMLSKFWSESQANEFKSKTEGLIERICSGACTAQDEEIIDCFI